MLGLGFKDLGFKRIQGIRLGILAETRAFYFKACGLTIARGRTGLLRMPGH